LNIIFSYTARSIALIPLLALTLASTVHGHWLSVFNLSKLDHSEKKKEIGLTMSNNDSVYC